MYVKVSLKNRTSPLIYRRRTANFRPVFGANGLWAGARIPCRSSGLSLSTCTDPLSRLGPVFEQVPGSPVVTRGLFLSRCTDPLSWHEPVLEQMPGSPVVTRGLSLSRYTDPLSWHGPVFEQVHGSPVVTRGLSLSRCTDPLSWHGASVFAVSSESPPQTSRLGVIRIQWFVHFHVLKIIALLHVCAFPGERFLCGVWSIWWRDPVHDTAVREVPEVAGTAHRARSNELP